jgi:hypothetical protein
LRALVSTPGAVDSLIGEDGHDLAVHAGGSLPELPLLVQALLGFFCENPIGTWALSLENLATVRQDSSATKVETRSASL